MPRFFEENLFPPDPLPETVSLTGDNAFHLVRVLRARPGEAVSVVAGDGRILRCRFSRADGQEKSLFAVLTVEGAEEPVKKACRVTLIQGMPKGKKTDLILQKATELGADRIAFVYMDRSVPVWDGEGKADRFRRIAAEAASQCGRADVPEILLLPRTEDAVRLLKESEIYFACYEAERQRSISERLSLPAASLSFLIGPEGGVSPREIALLEEAGVPTVSLGRRVLRTETAPLAVLAMILYEKELTEKKAP